MDHLKSLFEDEKIGAYDFSRAPERVARVEGDQPASMLFGEEKFARWKTAQESFIKWTGDKRIHTREYVLNTKTTYDEFFSDHGPPRGHVLDVGGGWGLFRQWWEPGYDQALYIVHDPGIERFERGPHEVHREIYQQAFNRPLTFVQGFGEDLPYKEAVFDYVIAANVLDHCAEPAAVFAGISKCIKTGGRILVLQDCSSDAPYARERITSKLKRYARHPGKVLSNIVSRLFYPDHHMCHFSDRDIRGLLETHGFKQVEQSYIAPVKLFAFMALRECREHR